MPVIALPFDPAHPVFAGHFPGQPIVPGVLLLAWVQEAIELQTGLCLHALTEAKFHHTATPADRLELDFACSATALRFELRAGDRKIASGRFPLPAGAST